MKERERHRRRERESDITPVIESGTEAKHRHTERQACRPTRRDRTDARWPRGVGSTLTVFTTGSQCS